jgi:hypothetical protein
VSVESNVFAQLDLVALLTGDLFMIKINRRPLPFIVTLCAGVGLLITAGLNDALRISGATMTARAADA